jgi:hypothetical protein
LVRIDSGKVNSDDFPGCTDAANRCDLLLMVDLLCLGACGIRALRYFQEPCALQVEVRQ